MHGKFRYVDVTDGVTEFVLGKSMEERHSEYSHSTCSLVSITIS